MAAEDTDYERVAASQTNQILGPSSATTVTQSVIKHLLVVPATLDPGAISIKDGADTAITVFTGGSGSVTSLHPFSIFLDAKARTGSWQVTTGADVSVIAVGRFRT